MTDGGKILSAPGRKVIEHHDKMSLTQQQFSQMTADKPRSSRDQTLCHWNQYPVFRRAAEKINDCALNDDISDSKSHRLFCTLIVLTEFRDDFPGADHNTNVRKFRPNESCVPLRNDFLRWSVLKSAVDASQAVVNAGVCDWSGIRLAVQVAWGRHVIFERDHT